MKLRPAEADEEDDELDREKQGRLRLNSNMLGKRVSDSRALPLCRDDHQNHKHAQHRGSEEAFWAALGIVPYQVTQQLYAKRDDMIAMRFVIITAIASRGKTP